MLPGGEQRYISGGEKRIIPVIARVATEVNEPFSYVLYQMPWPQFRGILRWLRIRDEKERREEEKVKREARLNQVTSASRYSRLPRRR